MATPAADVTGIVFSGGGARGAYEAGVLKYICEHFSEVRSPAFDVATGTSVGAIHAAYLAGVAGCPRPGAEMAGLLNHWTDMELSDTIQFDWMWLLRQFGARLFDRPTLTAKLARASLLDTRFLETMIVRSMPWREIRSALRSGRMRGLALPATQVATGRAVVFYDTAPGVADIDWPNDPTILSQRTAISPRHVLASASIPLFFPPVRIGGRLYSDGSLRINTPLSPALRLGVERLLVIRLRPRPDVYHSFDPQREASYLDPFYLLGKVFDTLMLDPVDRALNNLEMINGLLESAQVEENPAEAERLDDWGRRYRGARFRVVHPLVISPSEDLVQVAYRCLHQIRRIPAAFRRLGGLSADREESATEAFSYLLFDRAYTGALLELGYADAKAQHGDIETLLVGDPATLPGPEGWHG